MREFPKTQAVQDALSIVTDPDLARRGGKAARTLAWCVLMQTRGHRARQARLSLFRRPADGGAA